MCFLSVTVSYILSNVLSNGKAVFYIIFNIINYVTDFDTSVLKPIEDMVDNVI